MRAWVNYSLSPLLVIMSHDPVMVRKPSSFGKLSEDRYFMYVWGEPQKSLMAGLWPGPCLVYNKDCFPLCKRYQCSVCWGRRGLAGLEKQGELRPLCQRRSTSPSFEVACLFNLSRPGFPHPFMATFVQGYCHLLFLSLACLQFRYLKEDGSSLTMVMKWVTLTVELSNAAFSYSRGEGGKS